MAGSSIKLRDKLSVKDINNIMKYGEKVTILFDVSHDLDEKPPHFEINVIFDKKNMEEFGAKAGDTYNKLRLSTQELDKKFKDGGKTNGVKYEVTKFEKTMYLKAKQKGKMLPYVKWKKGDEPLEKQMIKVTY